VGRPQRHGLGDHRRRSLDAGRVIHQLASTGINWKFDRHFGDEWRRSLAVKSAQPLGEVKLAEIMREHSKGG
jgi:hypothetical protein